jgi:hypothetical protein
MDVLNELAVTIARGQSHGPIIQVALEKLNHAIAGKAAWFRLMEDGKLVPTQHVGVSPDFLRAIGQVGMDNNLAHTLEEKRALVVSVGQTPEPVDEQFRKYGLQHVILVPVFGKKSVIGMLSFGAAAGRNLSFSKRRRRRWGLPLRTCVCWNR